MAAILLKKAALSAKDMVGSVISGCIAMALRTSISTLARVSRYFASARAVTRLSSRIIFLAASSAKIYAKKVLTNATVSTIALVTTIKVVFKLLILLLNSSIQED